MTSEILHLVFNDFGSNISKNWLELRDDTAFCDVTLACEGSRVEAHKVILSSCSPVIKDLLIQANHPHPLLFFRGVKQAQITALLEFIYKGEVSLAREELDDFLEVAKELKIKGLAEDDRQIKEYPINNKQENEQGNVGFSKYDKGHIQEKTKDTLSSIVKEEYEIENQEQGILYDPNEESSYEPQIKMEEQDYYEEEEESCDGESVYLSLTYKCDICPEIVDRSGNDYKNHLQLVHGKEKGMDPLTGRTLVCSFCLQVYDTQADADACRMQHKLNKEEKETRCMLPPCVGKEYGSAKKLREHELRKHKLVAKTNEKKTYQCRKPFCLKFFSTSGNLKRHIKICVEKDTLSEELAIKPTSEATQLQVRTIPNQNNKHDPNGYFDMEGGPSGLGNLQQGTGSPNNLSAISQDSHPHSHYSYPMKSGNGLIHE